MIAPCVVIFSTWARKTDVDAVVAALALGVDTAAAAAASGGGCASIDHSRGCAAAPAGNRDYDIFVEEAEQEGDGSHKVQVDDHTPSFRLGIESTWRVFELKVAQGCRLARLSLACEIKI